MIQIVPQLKVLVACEPVDFRKGIDSLACVCRQQFQLDPFLGTLFVFRNRSGTALKFLVYDGQGFWLFQKRFSKGRLQWWPRHTTDGVAALPAEQLAVLPRSDADLLIVVESSPHRHSRDRLPEALRALAPLPCAADLYVLTLEEVDRFQREGSPLLRIALTTGQDLLPAD